MDSLDNSNRDNSQGLDYSTDKKMFTPISTNTDVIAKAKEINERCKLEDCPAQMTTVSFDIDQKEILDVFLPFASGVLQAAMELEVNCDTSQWRVKERLKQVYAGSS